MLHDEVLPLLAAAIQDLEEADSDSPLVAAAQAKLAVAWQVARGELVVAHARSDSRSLADALRAVVQVAAEHSPLQPTVIILESESSPHARALLLCAGELVRNVVAHAGATRCRISLVRCGRELTLTVDDDGIGLDSLSAGSAVAHGHFGLANVERRAAAAGGQLRLAAPACGGTQATVVLPAA